MCVHAHSDTPPQPGRWGLPVGRVLKQFWVRGVRRKTVLKQFWVRGVRWEDTPNRQPPAAGLGWGIRVRMHAHRARPRFLSLASYIRAAGCVGAVSRSPVLRVAEFDF